MLQIKVELLHQKPETIHVYGDNSILTELENSQIFLNYSCRQGHCGSCIMFLTAGEIHQKENLIPLSKNEILTCCAFPLTDITIKDRNL